MEQAEEFPTDTQFQLLRGRMRRRLEVDPLFWDRLVDSGVVYPFLQALHDAPLRQLMVIANACGHNWIWKMFIKSPQEGFSCIQADSFANKDNLPADFIEDLRRMELDSPAKYKQYVLNDHSEVDLDACYYADAMTALRKAGQIGDIAYDPALRVNLALDVGFDCTAIWFFQIKGYSIHVIDYYENTGKPVEHYAKVLDRKRYNYGRMILPHDAKKREMVSGKTLSKNFKDLGYDVIVLPREQNLDFGINRVLNTLPRCWFDEKRCEDGLEGLQHYRREYNDDLRIYVEKPLHDWSSHPASAFMYLTAAVAKNVCTTAGETVKKVRKADIDAWRKKYRRVG